MRYGEICGPVRRRASSALAWGDDAACRAGPVCPAAGRHCRFLLADGFHPVGRHCRFFCALIASTPWGWHCRFFCALIASTPWGWHCRFFCGPIASTPQGGGLPHQSRETVHAKQDDCFHPAGRGLAPAAVPQHYLCGTFSIDRVSGHHTSSLFTIPSYFDKRPPSATRDGVGTAALGLTPQGLRHLRMALWDDGGFRPVRGAGVSPAAAGGNFAPCEARPGALPPGPLRFFEKNRVKLLTLGVR